MSYSYQEEKARIFTEQGQPEFLKARDWVQKALELTGAFTMGTYLSKCSAGSDSWFRMALVDRLVELGELRELNFGSCAGQYRTFVGG